MGKNGQVKDDEMGVKKKMQEKIICIIRKKRLTGSESGIKYQEEKDLQRDFDGQD